MKRAVDVPGKDQYKLLLYSNAHREHVLGNQLDCVRVPEARENGRFSHPITKPQINTDAHRLLSVSFRVLPCPKTAVPTISSAYPGNGRRTTDDRRRGEWWKTAVSPNP
ncbi:MAG: hypothetical protein H6668_23995 [Ardenticatenaceae bacterium]|nr:hypothetical protein [Ardenticatenaceae bacterium]